MRKTKTVGSCKLEHWNTTGRPPLLGSLRCVRSAQVSFVVPFVVVVKFPNHCAFPSGQRQGLCRCCALLWTIPCRFEELWYIAVGCVTRNAFVHCLDSQGAAGYLAGSLGAARGDKPIACHYR